MGKNKSMMDKPQKKKVVPEVLNYNEIISYIEEKYNIKTRDYYEYFSSQRSTPRPYVDFWHFIIKLPINEGELKPSGSLGYIPLTMQAIERQCGDWEDKNSEVRKAISTIIDYINKEFGSHINKEGLLEVWIEW